MKTGKNGAIAVFFTQNVIGNQLCPKGLNNFFESDCFAMGLSGYLKHEYYFPPPLQKVVLRGI